MTKECPHCNKITELTKENIFRPFCSEKCKLIDLGVWVNEDKKISRPIESEDFYEDWLNILIPAIPAALFFSAVLTSLKFNPPKGNIGMFVFSARNLNFFQPKGGMPSYLLLIGLSKQ